MTMTRRKRGLRDISGQALLETLLIMPLMIFLILNVVNFGYCFVVALNLSAAPRSGVLYSIMGFSTPGTLTIPAAGPKATISSVSYVTYQDMTGALANPQGATVRVCSTSVGIAAAGTSSCSTFGSASFTAQGADPEPSAFFLQSVDIAYSFSPLIPGRPFGALLPAACTGSGSNITCTFYRHVSMRAMN
jgi:hypothetical protein